MLSQSEQEAYLREGLEDSAGPMEWAFKYMDVSVHRNPRLRVCRLEADVHNSQRPSHGNVNGVTGSYHLSRVRQPYPDTGHKSSEHFDMEVLTEDMLHDKSYLQQSGANLYDVFLALGTDWEVDIIRA
jgi:hypothetical protein